MILLFSLCVAVTISGLAWPFLPRAKAATISGSVFAVVALGLLIGLQIDPRPIFFEPAPFGWAVLSLMIVSTVTAGAVFFVTRCSSLQDRSICVGIGLLAVCLTSVGLYKTKPAVREIREAKAPATEYPPLNYFAVSRRSGEVEARVIAKSTNIRTGNGDTGPGVQVEFNGGAKAWFLVSYAWDRWSFTDDDKGRAKHTPAGLSMAPDPRFDPMPGQNLYTLKEGRYGGKVLESKVGQGVQVEYFNGKREWLSLIQLYAKWDVRDPK